SQVQGQAPYVDDLPELKGTLYAAPVMSPVAHGLLRGIDASAALALPGVVGLVTAEDIPGDRLLATFVHDEPVLARDKVEHVGQVVALVVAQDVMQARRAARQVRLDIEALPAILTVRQALASDSQVLPTVTVRRGEPEAALARSALQLEGNLSVGGQEHFYLEGQVAYAMPQEQDQWLVHSSTQHPGEVQHWIAHALGIANHRVTVQCRRMGGGFGGKETQAGHMAVWACLAARKFGCPVKLRLDRDDDFMITGKRHPFEYDYTVGFDASGLITALKLRMLVNCGFSADLSGPVADRAIFHADNAYFLSDVEIVSHRCKTNLQSQTAFRGFGGPQGMIVIEAILGDIARRLGLDPLQVRRRNFYGIGSRDVTHYQMKVEDNILDPLVSTLARNCRYEARREQLAIFNAGSPVIKRGLALTPVKFGISFTATLFNQAGALVHV
ncbi:MAG: molybdopterin cofactor-binding domain-containing protein, partial [Betaproteobacteria bacterium]